MAILIVAEDNGAGFYDIEDMDPRPIERLVPKTGTKRDRVCGHVIEGTWFGIEPRKFEELFSIPTSIDEVAPFLEAPKELRLAILAGWQKMVEVHGTAATKPQWLRVLTEIGPLMRNGKPDRFSLIDDW